MLYMLSQRENVNFKWINHIKSIFDNVGLSYVWNQPNPIHLFELKLTVKQKLTDQFIQKWYNLIATSSRGNLSGKFKMEFKLENYLLKLSPNERALITKLRCCTLVTKSLEQKELTLKFLTTLTPVMINQQI